MAILVALFIVVPIVELYVIIQVGSLIGVWPTIALLLADALLGSLLLRHQGRGAWRRFNAALAERRFPGREVADGLLIAVGGTLLLTPGFVTDIVGLLFLIPPTRAIVRRLLRGYVGRRFVVVGGGTPAPPAPRRRHPRLRLRRQRRRGPGQRQRRQPPSRRPPAARLELRKPRSERGVASRQTVFALLLARASAWQDPAGRYFSIPLIIIIRSPPDRSY